MSRLLDILHNIRAAGRAKATRPAASENTSKKQDDFLRLFKTKEKN